MLQKFYISEKVSFGGRVSVRTMIKNKRGLSPLIATILLIAFAVALGAVVMNLGRTFENKGIPIPGDSGCVVNGGLEIAKIGGEQKICFVDAGKDSSVDFTIHNSASADVEDLQITIYGSNDVFNKDSILREVMKRGEGRRIKLRYDKAVYGSVQQIVITPIVRYGSSVSACTEAKLVLEDIGACK